MTGEISITEKKEMSNGIYSNRTADENALKPGNFEDAIRATGFGKFNIALICIIVPGAFAQIAEQSSLTYVIPIAQCDLDLSLEDKGLLLSIPYTGMILSAFFWGCICDTYGRRKIVIIGYLINTLCYIISAFAQNFTMLLIAKFFSGFVFTGPFSATTSYLTEFHATENRSRIHLLRGTANGIAVIFIPMIAWAVLTQMYEISIIENINLRPWNFFVAICCIPSLMTGIIFIFMPESPRFLMASGKTEEALMVFKKIYRTNTGRVLNSFPIKALVEESVLNGKARITKETSIKDIVVEGFLAVKPLFSRPHILKLAHACINSLILLMGAAGMKLWYPQILQSMNDLQKGHGGKVDICNIVNSLASSQTTTVAACTVNLDNSQVYINASIQGSVQLVSFFLAGFIVNKTGNKLLTVMFTLTSAICPIVIYFITSGTLMLVLLPIIITFSVISGNILITITMEMFPTAFRATALNLHMMSARVGIVSGNVLLPYLIKAGCLPMLSFVSIFLLVSIGLTYLLPDTHNKDLA